VSVATSHENTRPVPGLDADVVDWITRIAGGGRARVTPFGHHRPLWSVDVVGPDGTVELFVRGARDGGSVLASVYNLEREAAVIQALTRLGVPTPRFVGFDPDAHVLVLERVPGRGDFHHLDDSNRRRRVADRFIEVLAGLHRHLPRHFGLSDRIAVPVTPEEHALGELEIAEPLYDAAILSPEPVITLSRRWLRRHVPRHVDHTCFVQGDTGPGNFVFDGDDVWLVDMEISHFGDPMEDLAAVCVRDMVTPFVDLPSLFARYESLTAWPLDVGRIRYHRVSKCVRSLMAIVSLAELGHQRDLLTWWAYRALYVRGACQALAEAMGLTLDDLRRGGVPDSPPVGTSWTALHELLAADLTDLRRSGAGHPGDGAPAIERALIVAAVLRRVDDFGAAFEQEEKEELERLLRCGVASHEEGLVRLDESIRSGTLVADDLDLLRFLTARADRQCLLVRPAMGPMADGRFSAIE
jgi:aminoglycoside phosphotransferase (APT) family kinase protein